jgi:hypothetical protein
MFFKRTRILLVVIVAMPLASCSKKTDPALIGEWEGKAGNKTFYLTFEKDGKLGLSGDVASLGKVFTSLTILTDFGIHPGANTPITYQVQKNRKLVIEADLTAMLEKLTAGGKEKVSSEDMQKLHPKETLTYAVAGKELTLTNEKGQETKFQRAE